MDTLNSQKEKGMIHVFQASYYLKFDNAHHNNIGSYGSLIVMHFCEYLPIIRSEDA